MNKERIIKKSKLTGMIVKECLSAENNRLFFLFFPLQRNLFATQLLERLLTKKLSSVFIEILF